MESVRRLLMDLFRQGLTSTDERCRPSSTSSLKETAGSSNPSPAFPADIVQ